MNADLVVVRHLILDLQAHTDASFVFRLVVRAGNVIVKLCLVREVVRPVPGNDELAWARKLNRF